jgi:hypothetical protein
MIIVEMASGSPEISAAMMTARCRNRDDRRPWRRYTPAATPGASAQVAPADDDPVVESTTDKEFGGIDEANVACPMPAVMTGHDRSFTRTKIALEQELSRDFDFIVDSILAASARVRGTAWRYVFDHAEILKM